MTDTNQCLAMIAFFQRVVDGLSSHRLCAEEERRLTEFFLQESYDSQRFTDADTRRYCAMGWYVYEMMKTNILL